jgi:hypothetical protein
MTGTIFQFCQWLESTYVAVLVRESLWGFPILVAIHIIGLIFSAGIVVWFDLRLLGISMRGIPVSSVYRRLMPWAFGGFAVMFTSGGMLAAGFATSAYHNIYFLLKITALLGAGINALVYHANVERRIALWDRSAPTPLPARMAGLISIVLWATVIMAGRMISYTLYSH